MTNRLNLSHSHDHCETEENDEELFVDKSALVFDSAYIGEEIPSGFDAVRIPIDGTASADLCWKEATEFALRSRSDLRIFWDLDLGLFNRLKRPLSDQTQFQTLCLSLEYFRDTLWKTFRDRTVGLCLYRGNVDFSQDYPWDEEQIVNLQDWVRDVIGDIGFFSDSGAGKWDEITPALLRRSSSGNELLRLFCRDAGGEYLNLLATQMPDPLPLFVLFDATSNDPYGMAQLISKERYPRIHVGVKENVCGPGQLLGGEFGWEGAPLNLGMIGRVPVKGSKQERARLALCLPKLTARHPDQHKKLANTLRSLHQEGTPFRVIPEALLSSEWDELDEVIIDPQHIDKQLSRKLEGFRTAGGVTRNANF